MTGRPPVLARVRKVLRDEGVRILWFKVLGETVYRRMVLVERPLDQPVADIPASVPVEFALLAENDVAEYRRFRPQDSLADIAGWFAAGRLCFVARYQGRIVHSCWISRGPTWIDYLGFELPLAPDEACACGSFTDPAFRGLDVAPARLAYTLRYLQRAGDRRVVSLVVHGNQASLRYAQQAGYRVIGTVSCVRLGPYRRISFHTAPGAWRPAVPVRGRGW